MRTGKSGHGTYFLPGLAQARDQRFVTQVELEEMAGVPQATISSLERGRRGAQRGTIRKLAKALGATPQELMREPDREEVLTAK